MAQLTQRTNQMNFTAVRRSEADIQALLESGKAECLTVHVSDRFGSYGLAGVIVFRGGADAIVVDTFLLSCRALGRGVEHRMLAALGEIAATARALRRWRRASSAASGIARRCCFWKAWGCRSRPCAAMRWCSAFRPTVAAGIKYEPARQAARRRWRPLAPPTVRPGPPRHTLRAHRQRTARRRKNPGSRARRKPLPSSPGASRPPSLRVRTSSASFAASGAEMLGVPPIGIHDNFFDLGGHSLLAVQLLSRLKDELGIELSLEVVYGADFTVAELAKAIELREIEMAGADRYAALLAEVESLSDEEVRELLAKESAEAQ